MIDDTQHQPRGNAGLTALPLEGIRVVDLTVVWSGPGSTTLLGDLGAEVIRVEGVYRTSRQRSAKIRKEDFAGNLYAGRMYPEGDPGSRPYDRNATFNWHARNKLSAAMCLETPEGHEAFLRLIAKSDVFVENNSKNVLDKLAIGYDVLQRVNPQLIVARMPPLGLNGPMSDYLGYGPNFNSLVGIQAMDGYEGEDSTIAGDNYHMDEAGPSGMAFAIMAALWHRETTGQGQLIEFPQAENVMQEIGEYFLDYQMNGRTPPVLGNSDPVIFQGVFPTAEVDVWVAISIRDDRDWAHMAGIVGPADYLDRGRTAPQRLAHAPSLRDCLAEWTSARTAQETVDALQSVKIPASQVMSELRLLDDPHLVARNWFQERSHPHIGTHRYPGHPWRAVGFDLAWGRPVPGFGEDNDYVYKELLGYTDAEFADLVDRGLVAGEQLA
jgi:crotonobetainyl-CoA:carnitine CoA-transferase CaiB-like acyl-CoA transferase